jgi:hypothetical protein
MNQLELIKAEPKFTSSLPFTLNNNEKGKHRPVLGFNMSSEPK